MYSNIVNVNSGKDKISHQQIVAMQYDDGRRNKIEQCSKEVIAIFFMKEWGFPATSQARCRIIKYKT